MNVLSNLRCVISKLLHRSEVDADMEAELCSHRELRADDLERSGLNRAEAERLARLEFGGHVRFKEECREALGGNLLESVAQDLRFAIRVLRKSPGFTVTAVLTLAFAIGANAVVFGLLNGIILHPLHVPRPDTLYGVQHGNEASSSQSYPDYLDLRDRNRTFEAVAAYNISQAALDTGKEASRPWITEVSGNYFDVLGIRPHAGRMIHATDEHGANSAPFIVLGYDYWHVHFQGDRGVVGRKVRLNKHPYTIVGVAPPAFNGTLMFFHSDLFVPIVNQEQLDGFNGLHDRGKRWVFMTLGHLKAGVTRAQAIADLNSIGSYLEKTYPKEDERRTFTLARPSLYGDYLGRPATAFLTALMLLAGLILLAACANLGGLFAARAADRGREVAMRLALGSSRGRILQGLLTEALLIALLGGSLGSAGSVALLHTLSLWQPFPRFPIQVPVEPDANVYAVALLLALVSGLLFGLVPVRQVLRTDPYQAIKSGSRTTEGRRLTVRDLLLVVQITICAVLVTSSLVAVRGLVRSLHSNVGFESKGALLVETLLDPETYPAERMPVMEKRLLNAMQKSPGVTAVGAVDWPPLVSGNSGSSNVFPSQATDLRPSKAAALAVQFSISPGYLDAARTTLLSGRSFTWQDDAKAPHVAVINQQLATRLFGSVRNAIGREFKVPNGSRIQVVGVVEDGKYEHLTEESESALFLPLLQAQANDISFVIRSDRDSQQLAAAMRATLRSLDPGLPSYIETWSKGMDLALFPSYVASISLGIMGAIGAMLAITGVFGMAAYSVSRRLRELGIRMALGAQTKQVLATAIGRAVKLLAFGSVVGLLLGILASGVLSSIVYEATPRDPLVLTGVVLAMLLLGLVATWIPAQRAVSISPLSLLRED